MLNAALIANQANPPRQSWKDRPLGGERLSLFELANMQRVMASDATNLELGPRERATCAIAWEKLEGRRCYLIGKAGPGQFRPEPKPQKPATTVASWEEPKQVKDAEVVAPKPAEVSKDVPQQASTGETNTIQEHKPQ